MASTLERRASSGRGVPVEPAAAPVHRIEYIDGLRALAVLAVVVHHVSRAIAPPAVLAPILHEGAHGVDLFFVLSGFCLAFPTLSKLRHAGATAFDVVDFGAKRLVRILPPFYIASAVLVVLFTVPHLLRHEAPSAELPPPAHIVASLFFFDGHVRLLNGAFWTLMVEFRWYFAFPLLLAVWVRAPRAFGALALASFALYQFTRAHALDLGTLPGFMLGIVAADVRIAATRGLRWPRLVQRAALPLAVVCAALGVAVESHATIPGIDGADVVFAYQPTILGWQLAVFFLVVAAGAWAPLRGLLAARPLVAVGIASYSIYLVHQPVISVVAGRLPGLGGAVVTGSVAVAVGFAFWALAELPFTTGGLRRPLLAAITPLVARAFGALGVGRRLTLTPPAEVTITSPAEVPTTR